MIKHIAAVAVVLTSSFAFAGTAGARYELKRVNMGPRSDQYILVRVHEKQRAEQPYALTGETQERRAARPPVHYIPSHVKGTHGPF